MEVKPKKNKMNLFTAFEQIVILAENSALSKEFYKKAAKYIKYVTKKLNITDHQSVMLAMFLENSEYTAVHIGSFAKYLKCRTISLLCYVPDIDELEKRQFIVRSRDLSEAKYYRISAAAVESFKNDECYQPRDISNLTCNEFIAELEVVFNNIPSEMTYNKVSDLLDKNPQLNMVKCIKGYTLDMEMETILLYFIHMLVNEENDSVELRDIEKIIEDKRRFREIRFDLRNGDLQLQLLGIIEYGFSGGFANRESFRLSNEAKEVIFFGSEIYLNTDTKRPRIRAEEISPKILFFDDEVDSKLNELYDILEDKNYKTVQKRLVDSGLRCGLTCLFFGHPGTGKTESVLQLARRTNRDVVQVDVSKLKSMWVGQSEKNIKALFAQYRQRVRDSKITPILLFNEADSIIGTRQEGAAAAVDKLENTLLSIILQEMETLEGIMIATTNLENNMDNAFERRFLVKIRFNQPSVSVRKKIFETMIPKLSDFEYSTLASKYELSGGQIENVARRFTINNILHGESENRMKVITGYCESEKIIRNTHKIGF